MHLPDGFLNARVALLTTVLGVGGLSLALRQTSRALLAQQVPLLGLSAAFVFAVQMLNFPIVAGTSGHLMGGTLVAIVLGPSAATVVMSAVLIIQFLGFADGGLTTLGANIFNIAMLGTWGGYIIYSSLNFLFERAARDFAKTQKMMISVFFGACVSVLLSAVACSGELALSGTMAWSLVFPVMTRFHFLIGLGEGMMTSLILLTLVRNRPEFLSKNQSQKEGIIQGFLISCGLAFLISPFASPWPDGLEKAAELLGFRVHSMTSSWISAPFADYRLPGTEFSFFSSSLPGLIGVAVLFLFVYGIGQFFILNRDRCKY